MAVVFKFLNNGHQVIFKRTLTIVFICEGDHGLDKPDAFYGDGQFQLVRGALGSNSYQVLDDWRRHLVDEGGGHGAVRVLVDGRQRLYALQPHL